MNGIPVNPASDRRDFASLIGDCALSFRIAIGAGVCAITGFLVTVLFGVADRWFDSETFALSLIPSLIALIYSIGAGMRAKLEMKAGIEDEERYLLERKGSLVASAFDEENRPPLASQQFSAYVRYAPKIISAAAFLTLLGALYLFWTGWGGAGVESGGESGGNRSAFIAAAMALLFFFFGVFCIGQSRTAVFRWLRPVGVWMVLASVVMVAGAAAILLADAGYPHWDTTLSKSFATLLAILTLELASNFIMEFYRPRTVLEERPVCASRLLALVTEHSGLRGKEADTPD